MLSGKLSERGDCMRRWISLITVIIIISAFTYAAESSEANTQTTTAASMSAQDLEAKADALRAEKDNVGAAQLFELAIRKQPNNPVLYNKLGIVELHLNQVGRAASHFNKAVKLNPKYAEALNNIGTANFLRKDFNGAARYYRKALALDETRASYHVNLATTWEMQNKLNLAMAEYARALEIDPDALSAAHSSAGIVSQLLTPVQRASRYFNLAKLYASRGDVDTSLINLKKAKEEGYRELNSVYKQMEFAKLWGDPRLEQIVPRGK